MHPASDIPIIDFRSRSDPGSPEPKGHDHTASRRSGIGRQVLVAAMLSVCCAATMPAQPVLDFKRVVSNWPTIDLYFSVECAGSRVYPSEHRNFRIVENGIEVTQFNMFCPDPAQPCNLSLSLVFDASGSMEGGGTAGAVAAGLEFVGLLDSTADQAAVLWFNSTVTLAQQMTSSSFLLEEAIRRLPAAGSTAVWDGAYDGLLHLVMNGRNQCRAMIVMTDGQDNISSHSPNDIIQLAKRYRIRVFTIGLGSTIQADQLQTIADATGGRYYETPDPAELASIYRRIYTIADEGFQECLITYTARCPDGSARMVDLTVQDVCGGSASGSAGYTAIRDTTLFAPLLGALVPDTVTATGDILVPCVLLPPLPIDSLLHPSRLTVRFPPLALRFTAVETAGTLLDGHAVNAVADDSTVTLTLGDRIALRDGELLRLRFTSWDVTDTVHAPLQVAAWMFDAGCMIPLVTAAEAVIVPRRPELRCELITTDTLRWSAVDGRYDPDPVPVTVRVRNTGSREAFNGRCRLVIDPAVFEPVAPATLDQPLQPAVIPAGADATAVWMVRLRAAPSGERAGVAAVTTFDNHPDVQCGATVIVPDTVMGVSCSLLLPDITADTSRRRYDPMPAVVEVRVVNDGSLRPPPLRAELRLSGGARVADGVVLVGLDPPAPLPGDTSTARWLVVWDSSPLEQTFPVEVRVFSDSSQHTTCPASLRVPGLRIPLLQPLCFTPDSLTAGVSGYDPFTVTVSCANVGSASAAGTVVELHLPAGMLLDDGGDSVRRHVEPFMLPPYRPGDPIPRVQWNLRYIGRPFTDTVVTIDVVAWTESQTGLRRDSVCSTCGLRIPAVTFVPGSAVCDLASDLLIMRMDGRGRLERETWTVTATITNTGAQPLTGASTILRWEVPEGTDLRLDPEFPNNTNPRLLPQLGPGEWMDVKWGMRLSAAVAADSSRIRILVSLAARELPTGGPSCHVDVRVEQGEWPAVPHGFVLHQNWPNPFAAMSTIVYELPVRTAVRLVLVDVRGRTVRVLDSGVREAGTHSVAIRLEGIASSVYGYRLETPHWTGQRRLVLSR